MRIRLFHITTASAALALIVHCGTDKIAGNGTLTGNPTVAGALYNADHTPAAHATVRFYPVNYNPQTGGLGKTAAIAAGAGIDSVTTDDSGHYSAMLDSGTYNLLASGDNNLAYRDSVVALKGDTVHSTDTLKTPGSLSGVIKMHGADDPRSVFIIFLGTGTVKMPDSISGTFTVPSLAQGSYRVRFLTFTPNYKVLDTTIAVAAGTTTSLLQPIQLQYIGIPVPTGLRIQYDTNMQIVTLSWNKPTTGAPVASYNVYRKDADSANFVQIKGGVPGTDTAYSDSTGVQDRTYQYKVAAVDTTGAVGGMSGGVGVTVVSAFPLLNTIDVTNISTALVKAIGSSTSQNYYILSRSPKPGIFLLNGNGIIIDSIGIGILLDPFDMVQDSIGNIYVADVQKKQIFKFDSTGQMVASWNTISTPVALSLSDSLVIVGTDLYTGVEVFNHLGRPINSFQLSMTNMQALAVGSNGQLFVLGDTSIAEFTTTGLFIKSVYFTNTTQSVEYNGNGDLISIGNSMLMILLNNVLYEISENGNLISKLTTIGTPQRIHFSPHDKKLWVSDVTGSIKVYQLK